MSEKRTTIIYKGNEINVFFVGNTQHVSLSDILRAVSVKKSVKLWISNKKTLEFLQAWEKQNNPNFVDSQMKEVFAGYKAKTFNLESYLENTNAIGLFERKGGMFYGIYAYKDIALRFAAWLSPQLEIELREQLNHLKEPKIEKIELGFFDQMLGKVLKVAPPTK